MQSSPRERAVTHLSTDPGDHGLTADTETLKERSFFDMTDQGGSFFDTVMGVINSINSVIWADWVLYTVLAVGVLFTLWTGFCQFRALSHGTAVTAGKYDDKDDPGAINHFQALFSRAEEALTPPPMTV